MMTGDLAKLIYDIKMDDTPKEVIAKTKLCILDFIADAVAGVGSKLPSVEIILDYVLSLGAQGTSTLIGTRHKASAAEAALVNSIAGEVLELGDGENRIIGHPGQSIVPAVLAVAEKNGSSGKDLIEAVLAGYEAMLFVGDVTMPMAYDRGFSASACLGNFGAAAGVAKLLGFSEKKVEDALALSASASGYLRSWNLTGTMDKDLMVGEATHRGVLAALLAGAGYTGTTEILEGDLGFCRAMAGEVPSVQLKKPHLFRILDVYFKPYPSCRVTHSTIDACLKLYHGGHLQPGTIERVRISTNDHGAQVAIPAPTTFVAVRFSQQYAAAVTLLTGKASLELFSEDYAKRPEVRELLSKSEVKLDPAFDRSWPEKYSSRVEVWLTDGRRVEETVDHPKGDMRNPMSESDVIEKARDLMGLLFPKGQIDGIIDAVMRLEDLKEAKELCRLMQAV
jgi:2-methylcitrate dehydratase PrpD